MTAFLILGFFIGIGHAFEADHIAAIGTLASSGNATPKRLAFLGASWGIGHTTTLFLFSLTVIGFGAVIGERFAAEIEFGVGIMLIALGISVFWRMRRKKIHFHLHQHDGGQKHFHAHSHLGATTPHKDDPHQHGHVPILSWRAYLIGLVHGAAGSAGLVALTAAATQNVFTAMFYVLIFGIGSILGMATLTFAASWPLKIAEKSIAGMLRLVQVGVASFAIFIGFRVMFEAAPLIWGVA
ncbi:Nickel transporter UreH [hydrothermal vent metagenome]|uniref:Nickel transporter UreH n=1 Tax=hydrothermal vent metagenome TaxID=652676 RepID=A0A3B0UBA8_9ZZZZ